MHGVGTMHGGWRQRRWAMRTVEHGALQVRARATACACAPPWGGAAMAAPQGELAARACPPPGMVTARRASLNERVRGAARCSAVQRAVGQIRCVNRPAQAALFCLPVLIDTRATTDARIMPNLPWSPDLARGGAIVCQVDGKHELVLVNALLQTAFRSKNGLQSQCVILQLV